MAGCDPPELELGSGVVGKRLVDRLARIRCLLLSRRAGIRIHGGARLDLTVRFSVPVDPGSGTGSLEIRRGVRVAQGALIACYGGHIVLEENVYVGPGAILYGHGGLRVGRDTMIAAGCVLVPANHAVDTTGCRRVQPVSQHGIDVGEDVWLGARVVVLDGVRIGEGAVVGAGAVVARSVEPRTVVVGVPARPIAETRARSSTTGEGG